MARGRCLAVLATLACSGALGAAEPGEESRERAQALGIELPAAAADRREGNGPFQRLVIDKVMLIDGQGSPPRGPVRIEVAGDRIVSIGPSDGAAIPSGAEVLDGTGLYALPGFVDAHAHLGTPTQGLAGPVTPPEYFFKLWLGHGITTVREVGAGMGLAWTLGHKQRSEQGQITAPRMLVYAMFPGATIPYDAEARRWVRLVFNRGADGVKLRGATLEATRAVIEEASRLGMRTANHHDQTSVYHVNALTSARLGLNSLEHWYGLPEALFEERTIQAYPADHNHSDEQARFSAAGRLWQQAAAPGSDRWKAVRDELIALDLTLVPTFAVYEANRDLGAARDAEWHAAYTWPALYRFFQPDPRLHGSYHFDWTTADEIAWRENFRRWMQFVNDYKNAGGRVAAGSDAGFIYRIPGFGFVRELELLQEAGFHPLEVIQAATLNGAEVLGLADQIGSLLPGKKADIVLVGENPLANFKVLYGNGHARLDPQTGRMERVGGVRYTIKDGIVFDATALRADVREMVRTAR
ncbi:MAG: amidohydrolase family protein [Pseudomonadales bacterium]|nr:amidohydrolase family protein [Pseudomonadales bacterium]